MIAEDGLDYSTAKRKAVRQLLGQSSLPRGDLMPDNTMVEEAVREYQALFMSDTQPARLQKLREMALELMVWLEPFQPYLTGAVWNGTAGEHSEIVLQCFADSAKDLAIFLLNANIQYEVDERLDFRGRGTVEAFYFMWRREAVVLAIYDQKALRGALNEGTPKPSGCCCCPRTRPARPPTNRSHEAACRPGRRAGRRGRAAVGLQARASPCCGH